jgi:hypothetical protein
LALAICSIHLSDFDVVDVIHASSEEITIPEFHGNSFLEIPIKKPVGRTLNYEIWFLASKPSGKYINNDINPLL